MGQPRAAARPRTSGDSPCAEDGPPPPFRSWQAPPDGLFDVILPKLTAKQFVVVQLVCKDWSRSARYCLKDATPKRPDVDLCKLVTLYPNLTQLNLSFVEGLSTRMLTPLRQLTALRELCLSNVALQLHQHPATDAAPANDAAAAGRQTAAPAALPNPAGDGTPAAAAAAAPAAAKAPPGTRATQLTSPVRPHTRSRSRAATTARKQPIAAHVSTPSETRSGPDSSTEAVAGSHAFASSPSQRQRGFGAGQRDDLPSSTCTVTGAPPPAMAAAAAAAATADAAAAARSPAVAAAPAAGAAVGAEEEAGGAEAAGFEVEGGAEAEAAVTSASLLAAAAAARMFGGLGDVLLRLTKLQADLCPALTAEAIASLPNLTDLTVDTLVAPEALAPLARLRSLAVKKLANPEALDRLSGLTALLVNSDSSCASEFLPVCTRLPELQSLTFKTSSTKILQQPDTLCWQGFSRLSSLDLRAPAECLKPGLPALAELAALRYLALDLYCASDEELMVTVVAPPNLDSLFVSSDRSRSGGVIDVHPNTRLRSLRIRLYWTALNLVLPEGLPEPSPLPEPLSEDLDLSPGPVSELHRGAYLEDGRLPALAADAAAAAGTALTAAAPGNVYGRGARRQGSSGSGGGGSPSPPGAAGGDGDGDDCTGSPVRGTRRRLVLPAGSAGYGEPGSGGRRRRLAGATAAEPPACVVPDGEQNMPTAAVTAAGAGAGPSGAAAMDEGDAGADSGLATLEGQTGTAAAAAAAAAVVTPPSQHGGRTAAGAPHPGAGGSGGGAAGVAAVGAASYDTPARGSTRRDSSGGITSTPAGSRGSGGGVVPEMQLTDLCLDACFFLLYGSLVPVLRQFPHLRSLTMDNCLALENGELGQLCELSSLREVSLSGLHLVTDAGLRALGRLPRLSSLRVKGLRKLAVHAAQAFMRQKSIVRRYEEISGSFLTSLSQLSELRSLALKHLHTAGQGPLAAGLGVLSQLTRLEVKDVHSMSDMVLYSLTGHTCLQELSVLHCEAVTSRGRNAVVRSLGQRVALDFEGCSLPDITRPCALPTMSTQAQLIGDDQASSSNQPRRSCQHSNQH